MILYTNEELSLVGESLERWTGMHPPCVWVMTHILTYSDVSQVDTFVRFAPLPGLDSLD